MPATTALRLLRMAPLPEEVDDVVVTEEPLEIRVEGHSLAVVMRTPGHDRELVAGFLLTEGIIDSAEDLFELSVCPSAVPGGGAVDVALRDPRAFDFTRFTRHVFTAGSCGVCGKASIEAAMRTHAPLPLGDDFSVDWTVLFDLPERQRSSQAGFAATGGIHAAALFDSDGNLLSIFEDAGRHNAVDKLIGSALLENRLPLSETVMLLSGRASFELIQKALAARIPIVAAIGAPSSLAVSLADDSGITLCGFLRGPRGNIYTHRARISL